MECTGWLLDLYPDPKQGVILWIITQSGERLRLHQSFRVKFSVAGSAARLRQVWEWLRHQPIPVDLSRTEGYDLFLPTPITLLSIDTDASVQPRLFSKLARAFPDLDYYDADVQLSIRHAAAFSTFPLCRCNIAYNDTGEVTNLQVLDSPWDLDPLSPPLRILNLEPDVAPHHKEPNSLLIYDKNDYSAELPIKDIPKLLQELDKIIKEHDPDILLTSYGDTWALPFLIDKSQEFSLPLNLNRDPLQTITYKKERSYFSYGVIVHKGRQVHLAGRLHLDRKNSFLFKETNLDGILESARVTALSIQVSARTSSGTGISSMQILTALRHHILVPWHKQQFEGTKTARELVKYDHGGLVYQPIIGVHHNVAELDFISMYPSIMVRCNISPEKPKPTYLGSSDEPGLIPLTLKPLLEKRISIKLALGTLPHSDPRYRRYESASAAYKWLLVTCFGYLGYKNAKYGRIESHEQVTTWGREALLLAKEAAEDLGYTVIHMYVDALWVQKEGVSQPDQLVPLLCTISERTGLSIALDGIYRWIAFLPSKLDKRVSVPNRYFGAFLDGSIKYRGIDARRHDTPYFVSSFQLNIINILRQAKTNTQLHFAINQAQLLLQKYIANLHHNQIPLEQLVINQRLSREFAEYKTPSPVARALSQLHEFGKDKRPGEQVPFIFVRNSCGVHAWDLPEKPPADLVDVARYEKLLLRAFDTVMDSFTGY